MDNFPEARLAMLPIITPNDLSAPHLCFFFNMHLWSTLQIQNSRLPKLGLSVPIHPQDMKRKSNRVSDLFRLHWRDPILQQDSHNLCFLIVKKKKRNWINSPTSSSILVFHIHSCACMEETLLYRFLEMELLGQMYMPSKRLYQFILPPSVYGSFYLPFPHPLK